jgi:23S rRNA pseudouridine1911/1915/1917 synthase
MLPTETWLDLSADRDDERLDHALARIVPTLSRSRIQKLIEAGQVLVEGEKTKSNRLMARGERIRLFIPAPKALDLRPQEIPLHVLYQDEHLAVLEKPAGLVVHPAAGHEDGTLVNALLHHFPDLSTGPGIGGNLRPGIVHRIDKNTSGILLITKTDLAHLHLSEQFKKHSITRRYQGLCWGKLPAAGEWNDPIGRDPKDRKRMAPSEKGKSALTKFRRLEDFGFLHLFEAELFTGRTHQIRVHFSHHGFPLVGDAVYGKATRSARQAQDEGMKTLRIKAPEVFSLAESLLLGERQFLHARHLGFVHPATGENLSFESPLPPDLQGIVVGLRSCKKP